MTVQLVKECNQHISNLSQEIAQLTGSPDKKVSDRARRKMLAMVEQQCEMTRETLDLLDKGITFGAWEEMFRRLNSEKYLRRIDNAQGQILKIGKILLNQADLKAYYNHEIACVDKVAIEQLRASYPQLVQLRDHMRTIVE